MLEPTFIRANDPEVVVATERCCVNRGSLYRRDLGQLQLGVLSAASVRVGVDADCSNDHEDHERSKAKFFPVFHFILCQL